MRSIYVPVGDTALEALGRIARRERRHPSQQAAVLLEQAIHRDGIGQCPVETPSVRPVMGPAPESPDAGE